MLLDGLKQPGGLELVHELAGALPARTDLPQHRLVGRGSRPLFDEVGHERTGERAGAMPAWMSPAARSSRRGLPSPAATACLMSASVKSGRWARNSFAASASVSGPSVMVCSKKASAGGSR